MDDQNNPNMNSENENRLKDYKNEKHENTDFADVYGLGNQSYAKFRSIKFLQKKIEPYINKIRKIKYKLSENARARRLSITSTMIFLILFSIISAQIWTKGYSIQATPIDKEVQFLNGDTAKVNNVTYDQTNHAAMINISTNSKVGLISSDELKAKFLLFKKGDGNKIPNITLIPTYSNNFTILVNNLNPKFIAMKFILNDSRNSTIDDYSTAIKNGSNRDANIPMSNKGISTIMDYNKDNDTATDGTGLQGNIKTNNGMNYEQANKLLPILQKNNNTNITLKEDELLKHKGTIQNSSSPRQVMVDGLNRAIKNLNKDISVQNGLIDDKNGTINQINKQIEHLNSDQLNLSSKNEIDRLKSNVSDIKSDILQITSKVKQDNSWLKKYKNQLKLIDKGQIVFDKPQKPQKADFFNN